jgi:hypothetical protein
MTPQDRVSASLTFTPGGAIDGSLLTRRFPILEPPDNGVPPIGRARRES